MPMSTRSVRHPLRLIDLQSDPHNANRGTDRSRAALARSLREYGAGRSVLLDRRGCVIAGNKTVEQAKRLNIPLRVVKTDGQHLIAVQRDDLDLARDPRARALAIADNRVGELDLQRDVDMLKQLHTEGLDLSAFWTDTEFAALLAEPTTGLTDENAVVEPGPTDIVRGELFVLGRHRLLCGDATSAGDVARLLDGATPVLMTTDPPYGVSYDPAWRRRRGAVGRFSLRQTGRATQLPKVVHALKMPSDEYAVKRSSAFLADDHDRFWASHARSRNRHLAKCSGKLGVAESRKPGAISQD